MPFIKLKSRTILRLFVVRANITGNDYKSKAKQTWLAVVLMAMLSPFLVSNVSASDLLSIEANQLTDGNSAIDLMLSEKHVEVQHFLMAQPNRVIVDLQGVQNQTRQRIIKVNQGIVESVLLLESKDKLRLILNLSKAAAFKVDDLTGGMRLVVDGSKNTGPVVNQLAQKVFGAGSKAKGYTKLNNIDFRRTVAGNGKVIVSLSSSNVVVDFKEESGELVADFKRSLVTKVQEKRLDVVDFATPVNTIDIFQNGQDVRMVITPNGLYRHTVTQTDKEFIVEVSPISQEEIGAREKAKAGYGGEKLSLNFQRIPVRSALQVIADFTGLNIITSDSVDGDLSLRLNEVPWDQALDLILQTKKLSMRQKGNVVRVVPTAELAAQELSLFESQKKVKDLEPLVTELISVNYAKAEDIAELLKSTKSVKSSDTEESEVRSGTDSNVFDPDTGTFGSGSEPTTVTRNNVVAVDNSLISARGSVSVDARTNTILIQDTVSKIKEVRKLVAKLDVPVRQIQIETRIVEATDDFSRSLGARLGFTSATDNANFPGTSRSRSLGTVFGGGSVENNNSVRTDNTVLYPDSLSVNLGADDLGSESAARYAFQIAKVGAGYLHLLDLELSALQAEGKGKVIANPKITTTEKHEARIEQGQERVFGTSGGEPVTKKAVLGLTVTPQVTPDDEIILDVNITNDTFSGDATLNTKRIVTQTILKNGETIVIGGIYQQTEAESVTKTPFLGDIPILGHLFKKKTKRENRTELLIFLTPRLIKPEF
ncbi:MAG: type IV pilus assembly protein PilQ [Saprospiraceae bacterium]|jgi:type IV pilus assembly protein PilQ